MLDGHFVQLLQGPRTVGRLLFSVATEFLPPTVGALTNEFGSAVFTDEQANLSAYKFYGARSEP